MLTIMLVEDDEAIRFALQRFFVKKQVQTICCDTVQQARAALTPAVNLVLLDLNLPDGSGYDLCRIVKTVGDIPVIFLTVRDEEKDIVQGLDMGGEFVEDNTLTVTMKRLREKLGNPACLRTLRGLGYRMEDNP